MKAKFVNKTVLEFHKSGDPLRSLGVGVKVLIIKDIRNPSYYYKEYDDQNRVETLIKDDNTQMFFYYNDLGEKHVVGMGWGTKDWIKSFGFTHVKFQGCIYSL